MDEIRYLGEQEKQHTRAMYEIIFPEDSKAFIDYYYQWKTRDNKIAVMVDEKGHEVMIHLNPYCFRINDKTAEVSYIVAVATRPDCRRKGKMQQVMNKVLKDIQKKHQPFTFLLPADPAYYYGQGFVFFPEQQKKPKEETPIHQWRIRRSADIELDKIAEAANEILAEQYTVYIERDTFYYERLMAEMASENGELVIIELEKQIIGILAYGKGEKAEIKELLLRKKHEGCRTEIYSELFGESNWNEDNMRMMLRITDIRSFDGMLKGEHKLWKLQIEDDVIDANNGRFQIEWTPDGGSVIPLKEEPEERISIQELTVKIMNYMSVFIREWV